MTLLHLALAPGDIKTYEKELKRCRFALASYYYIKNLDYDFQSNFEHFILDSGAFSLFGQKPLSKDEMIKYCDEYADYIIKYNIKNFAELDVDVIYGYDFVLYLRKRLEDKVGRQCIPIWHLSRGKEEFIKMCKEYTYAGIGGIAKKNKISKYKHLYKYLNRLARKYNCKLHGMGFTPTKNLLDYEFYTVDSTSWSSGSRFATIYEFKNNGLSTLKKPQGKKLVDYKELDKHNMNEWIKYQDYCYRKGKIY